MINYLSILKVLLLVVHMRRWFYWLSIFFSLLGINGLALAAEENPVTSQPTILLVESPTASTPVYAKSKRPASVPDNYVVTPFGYFHPACVRQLAQGETLEQDGYAIRHVGGSLETISPCDYPQYTPNGDLVVVPKATPGPAPDLSKTKRYSDWPDNYVITPFGAFHPSCVRHLAEGETFEQDGYAIRHVDGSLEAIAPCDFPHSYVGPRGNGMVYSSGTPLGSGQSPGLSGWAESIQYLSGTTFGKLQASWPVPPAPTTTNDNQVIYFFNGLHATNATFQSNPILQPVLGWNMNQYPGWTIASWSYSPSGNTYESPPVTVNVGDIIMGTMKTTCGNETPTCGTWNIETLDSTSGQSTILTNTTSSGFEFDWAFGCVLEVYDVEQCRDYPATSLTTFSNVTAYDYKNNLMDIPWVGTVNTGLVAACGFSTTSGTSNQQTLYYSVYSSTPTPTSTATNTLTKTPTNKY